MTPKASYSRTHWLLLALLAGLCFDGAATKAQETTESSAEAILSFNDGVKFQNNQAFDLAVAEWKRFLEKYPNDPLADRAQHYLGVCYTQLKPPKLPEAIAAFKAAIDNHPQSQFRQDSLYNLGWSQFVTARGGGDKADYAAAIATLDQLLAESKDHAEAKYVADAHYLKGDALFDIGKKQEAVTEYQAVIAAAPESARVPDARYAAGVTLEELDQFADAKKIYEAFLANHPEHAFATEVKMRLAETVLRTGDPATAETMFAEVAAVEGFDFADHATFRQAAAALEQDKFAAAAALFASIPTKFPKSEYVAGARMDAGRCYYSAKEYAQAADWFGKAIAVKDPAAAEAAHWKAKILLTDGKPQEALELVEPFIEQLSATSPPEAKKVEWLAELKLDRANALLEIPGKKEMALAAFEEIAASTADGVPLKAQAMYDAAFTALELRKFNDAIAHADKYLAAFPAGDLAVEVAFLKGEALLQLKQYAEAEAVFAEALAKGQNLPDRGERTVRLALAQYLQKKYPETVATLEPVLKNLSQGPALAQAFFLIGASQYYSQKYEDAAPAFQSSLKASEKWDQADEALLLLTQSHRKLNQLKEATEAAQKLLANYPQSKLRDDAQFRVGECAYAAKDYDAAAAAYGKTISEYPGSTFVPYALYGQGWTAIRRKNYAEAEGSFSALLKDHPDHKQAAPSLSARAYCRRQQGNYQGAVEDITAYLKTGPEDADRIDALYELGLSQSKLKHYKDATATLETILKDKPAYANADEVIYELAWCYDGMDQKDKAAATFAQLIAEHPESPLAPDAHYRVGQRKYEQEKFKEAIPEYLAAKAKAKTDMLAEEATFKLGWCHYELGDYEQALAAFSEQLEEFPKGSVAPNGRFMQAECLFKLDRFAEAAPILVILAGEKMPTDEIASTVLLHGGQALGQLGKWEESIAILERLPQEYPKSPDVSEAYFEHGQAKFNLEEYANALKLYQLAAEQSRTEVGARARFMMGQCYFVQKKYDEAIKEFQQVLFRTWLARDQKKVERWQAKAAYEAARCHEVQIREATGAARAERINEALRFYKMVVEKYPESDLAASAKARVADLSKL